MSNIQKQIEELLAENSRMKTELDQIHRDNLNKPDRLSKPEGPYYTRHNQWAWITRKDKVNAWGYILGESGKLHNFSWYVSSDHPYIAEADYPSGHDLSNEPNKDRYYWRSDRNTMINGKEPLV